MGKVVGLIGSASGKIGNLVYAVTNGIQTARVYQPIVANPKTTAQSLQRAKGNLCGQLSGMVSRECILGLGGNARIRRGEFLRNLLRKCTAQVIDGDITAKLYPADIVFSRGDVEPVVYLGNPTLTASSLTVTVSRRTGVTDEQANAALTQIIVVFADELGRFRATMQKVISTPVTSSSVTFDFVSVTGTFYAYLYVVPIATIDGSRMTVNGEEVMPGTAELSAVLSLNAATTPLKWGDSVYASETRYPAVP